MRNATHAIIRPDEPELTDEKHATSCIKQFIENKHSNKL